MMQAVETPETADAEIALTRRAVVRREAVERLLAWGFDTMAIARIVGCDMQWIDAISNQMTVSPPRR